MGVLHAIQIHRFVAPPAQGLEVGEDVGDGGHGGVHRPLELILVVDQVRIVHVRPDRHGVPGIKRLDRFQHGTQPLLHGGVVHEGRDAALLVAGEEAVEGHDRGQPHIGALGDAQRHQVEVVDRLGVAGHENEPAGVQRVIDVGVVAANVERPTDGTGGEIQQHGIARPGLYGQLL